MKRRLIILFSLTLLLAACSKAPETTKTEDYDDGYKSGYQVGHVHGYGLRLMEEYEENNTSLSYQDAVFELIYRGQYEAIETLIGIHGDAFVLGTDKVTWEELKTSLTNKEIAAYLEGETEGLDTDKETNTEKLTWDDIATPENIREAKRINEERYGKYMLDENGKYVKVN